MFYFAVMNKNAAETTVAQKNLPGFGPLNSHFVKIRWFYFIFLHVKPVT